LGSFWGIIQAWVWGRDANVTITTLNAHDATLAIIEDASYKFYVVVINVAILVINANGKYGSLK
jgi:hypothetical protein